MHRGMRRQLYWEFPERQTGSIQLINPDALVGHDVQLLIFSQEPPWVGVWERREIQGDRRSLSITSIHIFSHPDLAFSVRYELCYITDFVLPHIQVKQKGSRTCT